METKVLVVSGFLRKCLEQSYPILSAHSVTVRISFRYFWATCSAFSIGCFIIGIVRFKFLRCNPAIQAGMPP